MTAVATTLLGEDYAFLRAARRGAQSWSGCCCCPTQPTGRGLGLPSCRQVEAWLEGHAAAAACPDGRGTGGAPTAAAERLRSSTASRCIRALARVCIYLVPECALTRRVPSTSTSLAGCPGGGLAPPGLLARPGGSGTGGAPTAAVERRRCGTAAGYMYVFGCAVYL